MPFKKKIRNDHPYVSPAWSFAISSLRALYRSNGVLLEDFVEDTFAWSLDQRLLSGSLPYHEPWIGFAHCPPDIPLDHGLFGTGAPQRVFQTRHWKESLPYCMGLFCLSKYHRRWLESNLHVPILDLVYPASPPSALFSPDHYLTNNHRKVIQVGFYLRRLESIFELPVRTLKKVYLSIEDPWVKDLLRDCLASLESPSGIDTTQIVPYVTDDEYDRLLSQNIVFVHLYDSSANTVVVECIIRNTPILVNPLPAITEYLGDAYPLYFETLSEAADKAEDLNLVLQAYDYLKRLPIKEKMTQEYFLKSFAESEIYRCL